MLLSLAIGGALVVSDRADTPASLLAALDEPGSTLWGWVLAVSSVVALIGVFWPGRTITALAIEQGALMFVTGCTAIYTVALFAARDAPGADFVAVFFFGFTWGLMFRIGQIHWQVGEIKAAQDTLDNTRRVRR